MSTASDDGSGGAEAGSEGEAGATGGSGDTRPVTPPWTPPAGTTTIVEWAPEGREPLTVVARTGWTVLRHEESPAAEVFAVSWVVEDAPRDRPVTFVFNGGPGAAAAYLHVGAVGPRRVDLPSDGSLARMPVRLVDNDASWLPVTDLVFVDPVGTGFSRAIPKDARPESGDGDAPGYHSFERDLAAMREFIGRWLSTNGRWASPVLLAGESYGGYRVGRLARSLQEDEGVGLAGVVLVSPAIELAPLTATDYSLAAYLDVVPSMAAGALHHGRCRAPEAPDGVEAVMAAARDFATGDLVTVLARGAAAADDDRRRAHERLADLLGLDVAVVDRTHGRVTMATWVREVLRDERRVAGLYDARVTTVDPFPDRDPFAGSDPTLSGIAPAFTMGINQLLRGELGVDTDRRYELLSMEVNTGWSPDDGSHALAAPPGAADDLRYGMAANPHMRALVVHGRHDLVTPLASSARLVDLMRLDPGAAARLEVRAYDGGHMFYTDATSRARFTADVEAFVRACVPDRGDEGR